jgi:hypothetical protein|tara:strand:- start:79 stop:615 length:537 start_codon:yes stop_codon:yes gene_type:complete
MNIKETKKSIIPNGLGNWSVYRHIRKDKNIPFYIGIGSDRNRPYNKKDRSIFWKNIANKTEYFVDVLLDNLTKKEAVQKEIEFIKLYGRVDLKNGSLCNMTCGGEGTGCLNKGLEDSRRTKISDSLKGRKHSDGSKLKMSIGQKKRITVTIDDVEYNSLRQAALALGIHKNTVKSRYL